jgi:DNA (cytosine-5)-methyltransferase 1
MPPASKASHPGSFIDLEFKYEAAEGLVSRGLKVGETEFADVRSLPSCDPELDPFAAWWRAYAQGPKPLPNRNRQPLRFIDLFSSVGGLSLGASEAILGLGMRGIADLAADVDSRALQVYRSNFRPRQTISDSVRSIIDFRVSGADHTARFAYKPTIIDDRLSSLEGAVDLVLAGPPCQGHSSLNNHSRHNDPKNLLYLTVPAAAVALGARHIVIENVPNVVRDKNGVVQTTLALLRDNGYHVTSGVLAAHRLGWPQTRKRFFLVASRDTKPVPLEAVSKGLQRDPMPVWWLIRDLALTAGTDADFMNSMPEMSAENRRRIDWLFDNDEYNLPNSIRPDCHKDGHTYPSTYGRMYPDQPAPTITGGFVTPGRGRFIHPTERRVLTPREAARIQGFPDWFEFSGKTGGAPNRTELAQWIGNAVPPILGFAATLSALAGEFKLSDENSLL